MTHPADSVPSPPFVAPHPAASPVTSGREDVFGFRSAHLLGIGGCGMSAIARAMLACGVRVSGSDAKRNASCDLLETAGARICIGHDAKNIVAPEAVVISSAIRQGNVELMQAQRLGIPILHRSEALARFLRSRHSILVSGTHGKTTTTSITGLALEGAGFDPWTFVGGYVPEFGGNTRVGGLEWAVAEADESDGTFEFLPAQHLIVTNIDCDHLDFWQTREAMLAGFCRVVSKVSEGGTIMVCADDPGARELLEATTRPCRTYSIEGREAHFRAADIVLSARSSSFDFYADSWFVARFELGVPGLQNVANAVAALGMVASLGGDPKMAASQLLKFRGAGRRFDVKGTANGITVIDDYAHHPTEIRATIAAAHAMRAATGGRLVAIFQPHRFTRTRDFMDDFAAAFDEADKLVLTDVYAAGEDPIEGVTIDALVEKAAARAARPVDLIRRRQDIIPVLLPHLHEGDLVLCLGAGDITHTARELFETLSTPPSITTTPEDAP